MVVPLLLVVQRVQQIQMLNTLRDQADLPLPALRLVKVVQVAVKVHQPLNNSLVVVILKKPLQRVQVAILPQLVQVALGEVIHRHPNHPLRRHLLHHLPKAQAVVNVTSLQHPIQPRLLPQLQEAAPPHTNLTSQQSQPLTTL